jgi:hypothetical protein
MLQAAVTHLAASPDGGRLAACAADGRVFFLEVQGGGGVAGGRLQLLPVACTMLPDGSPGPITGGPARPS